MITITRQATDGTRTQVELAPVGYQVPDGELASMYAALFGGQDVKS
jgi:hypothetical protein